MVTFLDGSSKLGTAPVIIGSAALDATFSVAGIHAIKAQYSGDAVFLPSSESIPLQVTGLATTLALIAPADAAPGSTVTLTATINSAGGVPTGQVVFHDGNVSLGTSSLNDAGVAVFRVDTLSAGFHSLTASYGGDEKFGASTSAPVTINIANADFVFGASPTSAAVVAGQSTQFILTITPAGGFSNSVTFSSSPVAGITCSFNPATVAPADGAASTALTVTTSASVSRYGVLKLPTPDLLGPVVLLLTLALFSIAILRVTSIRIGRDSLLTATAAVAIVALLLMLGGCGGYGGGTRSNRGTASITVIAQAGALSHTAAVQVTVQ